MVLKVFLVVLVILLSVFVKTPLAWGFSVERTAHYLQQSEELRLSQDKQWLRLGHYHEKWLGGYKSKIRGHFFLSPQGDSDPAAELRQTIQTLFSDASGSAQLQCRYLARTQWLRTRLKIASEDLVNCPARDEWKNKFAAEEVYLIFAANDLKSAASSFGHTFLRFHSRDHIGKMELLDYGVNFAAATGETDGILFALKGLFGAFPGFYSMMPFHQKIREYANLEGRDIWEYRMNLNPAQLQLMLNHLLELEGSYVPYYFLDDNCSYQILELIEVARPDLDLLKHFKDVTIPLDTLKVLGAQKNFLSDEKFRPSLVSQFEERYRNLNLAEKNELVARVDAVKVQKPPSSLKIESSLALAQRLPVLDAALNYLAIKEYRDRDNYSEWKYQLALERSALGAGHAEKEIHKESPLDGPSSFALYTGYGHEPHQDFFQLKLRRAFHDLLSRDQGVSPFSQVEVLGVEGRYYPTSRRWDLERLQLLEILSTHAVSRLDHPLSWKTSLGTTPKLAPFFEGGAGYSFDFNLGVQSRWVQLLLTRAYERRDHGRFGLGTETLLIEKISPQWRALQSVKYLGVFNEKAYLETEVGISYDLTTKIESRITYKKEPGREYSLLSLVF